MKSRTPPATVHLLLASLTLALCANEAPAAGELPDKETFLPKVRKNLRSNRLLLSQYTFNQTRETQYLDKKGRVKRTEQKEWEVFPGLGGKETFRRLVSQDGKPVSQKKRDKQNRRWARKREEWESQKGQKRLAKARQEEEQAIDEIFKIFKFEIEAREVIDGYPVLRVRFEPRPNYQPRLKDVRQAKKMRGVAWVHEPDHQLVRMEVELLKPISFGWGLVAKLHKGARLEFSRRLINDEIWLPSQSRVKAAARLMLFMGLRLESVDTYSNFKKFTVDTAITFEQP